jgi:Flp pilus assembly protein TadG
VLHDAQGERGSAVVDFVLVSVLVVALFAVVFQIGLALHARTVLVSVAAEGARYGANADVSDPGAVEAQTRAAVATAFTPEYAARARISPELGDVVRVRISAPLPLAFLPGAPVRLTVDAHALEEAR